MTGGIDNDGKTLGDAWLFDVTSRRWKEVRVSMSNVMPCSIVIHHAIHDVVICCHKDNCSGYNYAAGPLKLDGAKVM